MAPTKTRPFSLALTGGIGAGKTAALDAFRRHGAAVLSSDDVVHGLYEDDPDVRRALDERFGTTDRSRVGDIVFADGEQLAWLEGLLHPRVREVYARWLEGVETPIAVVEIPLLYESGADALFDAVVVITAPEELRRERAGAWVEQRSSRLLPDEEKIARAEFSYVNDGTLEELDDFVVDVLRRVT